MSEDPSKKPDGSGPDPLASLHKMSRTAGLGTTEYVEVNATAVAALLLGLASGLAVLGAILLIIPAVALVVAVVALRQIYRSAGTQTGKGIAILGMVLALLCVGAVGGREALHAQQVAAEKDVIIGLLDRLGKNLNTTNYGAAWEQFGPRFKEKVKKEEFTDRWTRVQASPYFGQIKAVRSNGIVDVRTDDETGEPYARGFIIFEFVGADHPDKRAEAVFRKDPQQGWVIEDLQTIFPPQPRTPQRAPQ